MVILVFAKEIIGPAVRPLLLRFLQRRYAVLVLLFAFLQLARAVVILGLSVDQLLICVVKRFPCILQLLFGVLELCPAVGDLLLCVGDLLFAVFQLLLRVEQLLFAVEQFLIRIGQLLLRPGLLLVVGGLRAVERFLGVGADLLIADLGSRLSQFFERVEHRLHPFFIRLVEGIEIGGSLHGQVQVGIVFLRKILLQKIHKAFQRTASHGAGSQRDGEVRRGLHKAHHRKRIAGQRVAERAVRVLHRDGVPDCKAGRIAHRGRAHHALAGLLRHAALGERGTVEIIVSVFREIRGEGVQSRHHVLFTHAHNLIGAVARHDAFHALRVPDGRHVVLRQAEGAHKAHIHKAGAVKIGIRCGPHIRRGGAQTAVEARPQRHNNQKRKEPAPRMRHSTQNILVKRLDAHGDPS